MSNKQFISVCCEGELCSVCKKPATHKMEETIFSDDPNKMRHPLTAYVCNEHFDMIVRPYLHPPQQGSADIVYVPVSDTPNVHKDAFWCEEVGEWLKPQPSGEAGAVEFEMTEEEFSIWLDGICQYNIAQYDMRNASLAITATVAVKLKSLFKQSQVK